MPVTLQSTVLRVDVDPDFGGDITRLSLREPEIDLLFATPWAAQAQARIDQNCPVGADSRSRWMSTYRGGWQLVTPHAGEAGGRGGTRHEFHGEASTARWSIRSSGPDFIRLGVHLRTVPCTIDRSIRLIDDTVTIHDRIRNRSGQTVDLDYLQHPALGGDFLDGRILIEAAAGRVRFDDTDAGFVAAPGSTHDWPLPELVTLDGRSEVRSVFACMSDFTHGSATLHNLDRGLHVTLRWNAEQLPFAWYWQELSASAGEPWRRGSRVIAIEPSSSDTSLGHAPGLRIPAGRTTETGMTLRAWRS
jgi:hypothetical protein